jgi:hypothetical protein
MNSPCEKCETREECLAWGEEYMAADGVFIKEMRLPKAGTLVPQHSHEYDHTSFLAKGSVLFEGKELKAPTPIFIPAGKKHTFVSLEDDTLILCIHNVSHTGKIEIREEHTLEEALQCLGVSQHQ